MKSVWHPHESIFCIHSGGPIQTGYDSVIKQWAFILDGSTPPEMNYQVISKTQHETMATTHLVEETIGTGNDAASVIATNVYINTSQGWRLLSHHASLPPELAAPEHGAVH